MVCGSCELHSSNGERHVYTALGQAEDIAAGKHTLEVLPAAKENAVTEWSPLSKHREAWEKNIPSYALPSQKHSCNGDVNTIYDPQLVEGIAAAQ